MPRFTVNYEDEPRQPVYHQAPPPPQQQSGFGVIPIPLILLCIPVVLAVFRPVVFTMPNGGNQPVIINNKNG